MDDASEASMRPLFALPFVLFACANPADDADVAASDDQALSSTEETTYVCSGQATVPHTNESEIAQVTITARIDFDKLFVSTEESYTVPGKPTEHRGLRGYMTEWTGWSRPEIGFEEPVAKIWTDVGYVFTYVFRPDGSLEVTPFSSTQETIPCTKQ